MDTKSALGVGHEGAEGGDVGRVEGLGTLGQDDLGDGGRVRGDDTGGDDSPKMGEG